jgi:hypothetical protein
MMFRLRALPAIAGLAAVSIASAGPAASTALAAIPAAGGAAASPAPTAYAPSFGDLMTMAVQPRHTKLGLAGESRNWTYATYELSELRNAFARIARTIPIYRTANTAELFAAMTQAPLTAVNSAITARDAAKFRAAYAQLTAACNACHASLDHAAIVIRTPSRAAFPDQRFDPAP